MLSHFKVCTDLGQATGYDEVLEIAVFEPRALGVSFKKGDSVKRKKAIERGNRRLRRATVTFPRLVKGHTEDITGSRRTR